MADSCGPCRSWTSSKVTPAVEGALAKVERVMPANLPDGEVVSALASAAGERRRVRMRYRSARGEETSRMVDPYAVLRAELGYPPTVDAAGSGRGKRPTKRSTADSSPSISISPALSASSSWRSP